MKKGAEHKANESDRTIIGEYISKKAMLNADKYDISSRTKGKIQSRVAELEKTLNAKGYNLASLLENPPTSTPLRAARASSSNKSYFNQSTQQVQPQKSKRRHAK